MPSLRDLTGQTFGNVLVNNRAENRRINKRTTFVMWNCTCLLCGKEFVSKGNNLVSGNTTTCGCTNKKNVSEAQLHDLTNYKFGRWTVMHRGEDQVRKGGCRKTRWTCKCECGTIKDVLADKLINGESTSCGCFKRELASQRYTKDLTGKTFGHLTVIERSTNVDNGAHVAWLCKCDCGNTCVVRSTSLKNGTTQSCGCLKFTFPEEKIENLLSERNINFKKEYKFKDLYRVKGHCLRFDFAVFNKDNNLIGLIEYQGQQHYKEIINAEFGKIQREVTDKMKKDYCTANNIPLYEIKYDDDISKRLDEIIENMNLEHDNPVPSS